MLSNIMNPHPTMKKTVIMRQPRIPATGLTRQHWTLAAPTVMEPTRYHLYQALTHSRSTPDCPTARNSQKRQYPGDSVLTVCAKASLSFPVTALEADSIPHTKRRRRTRKRSKMRLSVGTVIRVKHSQYKTTSATASTSRQLRLRPCIAKRPYIA